MSEPQRDNVVSMNLGRARRLLDDMVEHPFAVFVYKDGVIRAVTKGLHPDEVDDLRRVLEELD